MSDIVQRLRIAWEGMGDMANEERAEAADEIESLRAELRRVRVAAEEPENLNMQVDALRRRVRELTDRNARLQSQVQESEVREI